MAPHKEALTNELTCRRFRLAFTTMGLPDRFYHHVAYEERRTDKDLHIFLKFTDGKDLSVIVDLRGPVVEDKDVDFGLFLDQPIEEVKVGPENVIVLRGYLRPV